MTGTGGVKGRAARLLAGLALHAFSVAALSAQAPPPGPLVSGAWLQERLGDPAVLVLHIDARRDDYDAGHIPGARFVATSALPLLGGPGYQPPAVDVLVAALEAAGVGDDTHVVLTSGTLLTATRAWLTLDWLGHGDHASVLDGGPAAWAAEGRPLATDTPATATGSLTPRPRPEILADADWIAGRLDDPGVAFLDARNDRQYSGEDGGMGGLSAGHLPGAAHLDWESLVKPDADHRAFLPVDSMRTLFEQAGAAEGRTVVAYCVIGTRASLDYFVGRMLGYDMRFYEGSWHEWSARALPFVAGSARR